MLGAGRKMAVLGEARGERTGKKRRWGSAWEGWLEGSTGKIGGLVLPQFGLQCSGSPQSKQRNLTRRLRSQNPHPRWFSLCPLLHPCPSSLASLFSPFLFFLSFLPFSILIVSPWSKIKCNPLLTKDCPIQGLPLPIRFPLPS